jgi:hypothetical protein
MRTKTLIVICLVAALSFAACGDGGDGGFSEEARRAYLDGCLADGDAGFCDCTLAEFEKLYTEEEFEQLAATFAASDEPPEEFVEVLVACFSEIEGGG